MMTHRYVLCAPQGIGKTQHAEALRQALECQFIADHWDGKTNHGDNTLYITNGSYDLKDGVIAFHVEDFSALNRLITLLQS